MSDDFQIRFQALDRLYGAASLERLRSAHVAVIGLGGVGSWVVEALARSGVGQLTLVDLDEVCLSNVNRQLPALDGTIGRFKAEVLAERTRAINPSVQVNAAIEFFTESSSGRLLQIPYDAVVDAIDVISNKCRLIADCRDRGLPLLVCGGAGGRRDPTRIRQVDLAEASHDRLLGEIRRRLRRDYGFPPAGQRMEVPCVVSTEPIVRPWESEACRTAQSEVDARETASEKVLQPGRRLNCEGGLGSAAFVTGAFGFAAAAWAVETILSRNPNLSSSTGPLIAGIPPLPISRG